MARVTFTNAAESAEDKARKAKEKASEWAETVANAVKDPHVGALMLFMGMNADDFKEGGIGGRLQLQLLTAVARFLAPVMDAVESWLTNSFNANAAGKPAAPRPDDTVEARNAAPKPPQHQPTLG